MTLESVNTPMISNACAPRYILAWWLPLLVILPAIAIAADDEGCLTLSGPAGDVYARCVAEGLADAIEQHGQATRETFRELSDQCLVESVQTPSDWVK